jgi:hypothetical protein
MYLQTLSDISIKLSDITSKSCIITMFQIVDLQAVFHTQFVGMFTVPINTEFHIPSFSD